MPEGGVLSLIALIVAAVLAFAAAYDHRGPSPAWGWSSPGALFFFILSFLLARFGL